MLSVIIPTFQSERSLVQTLAALIPGATAGLVMEVIVTDGGSIDATAEVADHAGCQYSSSGDPLGERLKAAATTARAPWLLFMRPGCVPDHDWVPEVSRFIEDAPMAGPRRSAAFRLAAAATRSPIAEALSALTGALVGRVRPDQGLLISKQLYRSLGGHRANAGSPEAEFVRRVGKRKIAILGATIRSLT
jgi:glycosyltransferase involved in cell wall biosynthesis